MRPLRRNLRLWGPLFGAKRDNLLHRPLFHVLFSLAGGILAADWLTEEPAFFLIASGAALMCLAVAALFGEGSRLVWCLAAFFLLGIVIHSSSKPASVIGPYAGARAVVKVEGTVTEPVRVADGVGRLTLRASSFIQDHRSTPCSEAILVTIYGNVPVLMPGQRIMFPARLRSFANFNNPGRYDYEKAMAVKGLACSASVSDGRRVVPMGEGRLHPSERLIHFLKNPAREMFAGGLEGDQLNVLMALVLGEGQGITDELRDSFSRTGLSHVLAVSGLHVGMVAFAAFFLFNWIMLRSYRLALALDVRKWAAVMTFIPVLLYAFLSGFQISAQRALIMVSVFLFSVLMDRSREMWSSLALAGIIILAVEPLALFSISFQLSFGAVIGILWLGPFIIGFFNRRTLPGILLYPIGIISATVSATIFLLPVTSFYFNQISMVSIPANLIVVPILGLLVLPMGLLSVFLLPLSHTLSDLALYASALGTDAMLSVIGFFSGLQWASIWVAKPNIAEMGIFIGIIAVIPIIRERRWARPVAFFLLALWACDTVYWMYRLNHEEALKITYLDVAQGNAALIEMPGGKRMLVDGGGFARDTFDVGRFVVAPFLWSKKIRQVDYIVLSHPQADHMNGLRFIAKAFSPREFWHSGAQSASASFVELMALLKEKAIKESRLTQLKKHVQIGEVGFDVLHPNPEVPLPCGSDDEEDLNNFSLVVKATFEDHSFLFPGDIEEPAERTLATGFCKSLYSDVLLVPHHGSKTSSTAAFLDCVRPRLCIISCGRQGMFGFPHQEALDRLEATGAKIMRTDREGAIEIKSAHGVIEIKTFSGKSYTLKRFI